MDARALLDTLGMPVPPRLEALQTWLVERGAAARAAEAREDVHPLVLPLAVDAQLGTIGLLFWPAAPEAPSVVAHDPTLPAGHLRLVSATIDALLTLELARRDAAGRAPGPLERAAGDLYEAATVARSGLTVDFWSLRYGRVPHTFFEPWIEKHLARGDTDAARITADRACRADVGWARPNARRARLLESLGLAEQARDSAHLALLDPVWTLGEPFAPVARLAGWGDPIDAAPYRRRAATADSASDRAAHLMDAVAVEGGAWASARAELAAVYRDDGQDLVARLVAG